MCEENQVVAGDALGELIVSKGLVCNEFILDLNNALDVPDDFELPAPWNLPSRLFRFPIETHKPRGCRGRTIGLMHPGLGEHPYVKHVEAVLGLSIPRERASNDCGHSSSWTAPWWHAVDLVGAGHWRELRETAEFTTPKYMFQAAAFALRSLGEKNRADKRNRKTLREVRALLAWLDSEEPENRSASIRVLAKPSTFHDGEANRCPVNSGAKANSEAEAWAFVHGIEDGWMTYDRGGYVQWSELGQMRYSAKDGGGFTENTGQSAFAF